MVVFSKKLMEHYLDKHEVMTTADKNGDDGKNENTAYKHDTRAERALELTLELYLSSHLSSA